MPQLIETIEDMQKNIATVESYLSIESSDDDFDEMCRYIKKGHNFVAYLCDGIYHFVPSRFIGYKNNSLPKHWSNRAKHLVTGTETDKGISRILGNKIVSGSIEKEYVKFCELLDIKPEKRTRKFWLLKYNLDADLFGDDKFSEGEVKLRVHKRYERNKSARDKCVAINGAVCKICGMDFEKVYGKIGKGYIQVHHIVPISEIDGKHDVDPTKDLIPVCANCHCMLHRKYNDKYPTISDLKRKFEKKSISQKDSVISVS
jgi:5-methylcytosine-specific restriction protein A